MARITIIGPEGQQVRELLPHNTLGRHPDNTCQVLDRVASKEHCHIDLEDGHYILKDLDSLNGTFVNGERVARYVLSEGDEFTLGTTRIVFSEQPNGRTQARAQAASTDMAGSPAGGDPAGKPRPANKTSRVTMSAGMVESHIRTKLMPLLGQTFVPESMLDDVSVLRQDYEKLRASYEVARAIGVELDVDNMLTKILDCAFDLLPADRGVVLMYGDDEELEPRCIRTKKASAQDEEVVLSNTIINEVLRDKAAVLSSDASVDSRFQGAHSIIMQGIRSSMAVPLLYQEQVFGIMLLDSQIATNAFKEKDLQLLQNIANQAAVAIQNSLYAQKLEKEAVTRERFQRLLSPAIAEQVIEGKVDVAKGGELRETTVLFSDIRGFTAMSEARRAEDIVAMLNDYFERMVEILFQYEGTLDKFVGDEIMALFGSPVGHEDDAFRAVKTALEMHKALAEINAVRASKGEEQLRIGIGVNTGHVIAGYLGSSRALEYTVIGDPVNVGARLCSAAKAGQILISQNTWEHVNGRFEAQRLEPISVKGKSAPLQVYNVTGER